MSQNQPIFNQVKNDTTQLTFQQKSTTISIIIMNSATAYYIANMWPMRPVALASETIPAGYASLVLTTIAFIVVAQIVTQAVLAFGSGSTPAATAHEKLAALKARRNANGVLAFGILAAVGAYFLPGLTPFYAVNLAFLGLIMAENVEYALQFFYARK